MLSSLSPALTAQTETEAPSEGLELYLLVGQSNMAGRGKVTDADRQPHPRIFVFNRDNEWASQGEPLHFDKPQAGVGLGFTFAKLLAERHPDAKIGLIPCAVGGTSMARWKPDGDGDCYNQAIKRARIALQRGELKGILWHQGEGEAGNQKAAEAYAQRLAALATSFRQDLGAPDVPFIAGELGEFLYTRSGGRSPFARTVNEQINLLPTLVPNAATVSSAGLGHLGDELHFNADAARELGRRYFEALEKLRAAE